ncbi:MAG: MBL fold metallo-hydrolase [Phycisphaerales bacterium]
MHHRIISIGALDRNPYWDRDAERAASEGVACVRPGHSTCTLVISESHGTERRILVDPGLPAPIIAARLNERSGLRPEDITHVFLTCFRPEGRRGLDAFEHATWWISVEERENVGVPMVTGLRRAREEGENELADALERDVALLQRCEAAPDTLADRVDLFPLPGVTPGMCGLLLEDPRHTTLICGDALLSFEHIERGQIAPWTGNLARAKESFAEAIEIADLLIPGRDNLLVNPVKRPF